LNNFGQGSNNLFPGLNSNTTQTVPQKND